jgi:hypothetical protein
MIVLTKLILGECSITAAKKPCSNGKWKSLICDTPKKELQTASKNKIK